MDDRPGKTEQRDRAWHDDRGLGSRRVRLTAFSISIALHLVAIVLYTSAMRVMTPEGLTIPLDTEDRAEQGVDLIQLLDIEDEEPAPPEEPEEIEEVSVAGEVVRPPSIPSPFRGELVPPGPSAAERLRVTLLDARLWAEPPPEFYELSTEEREELLASARIVEWYDSVAAARAADARLTDWTFTDGQGGRWGVADGRIYLGDFAVPIPISFGTPVGKRDEVARRMWEFDEIQRQSQQYLILETWKERSEAIRARRDRERATAGVDTLGIR
jgi:hypothetical protein